MFGAKERRQNEEQKEERKRRKSKKEAKQVKDELAVKRDKKRKFKMWEKNAGNRRVKKKGRREPETVK